MMSPMIIILHVYILGLVVIGYYIQTAKIHELEKYLQVEYNTIKNLQTKSHTKKNNKIKS